MKHLTPRQHFWEYARKSLIICIVCYAVPFFISFLGLGRKGMIWLTLGTLGLFCLTWAAMLLRGISFLVGINRQAQQGLPFESGPLDWLGTSYTSTWVSDNWLIHAGHVALHHSQIADVAFRHSSSTSIFRSCSHDVVVTTIAGHRYHWPLSKASIEKLIRWHNAKR